MNDFTFDDTTGVWTDSNGNVFDDEPFLQVTPAKGMDRTVVMTFVGAISAYIISYGDGMRNGGRPGDKHQYTFAEPGLYTATATYDGNTKPDVYNRFKVVPDNLPNATVTAPDNTQTVKLVINDPPEQFVGRYRLTWYQSTVAREVYGEPGYTEEHWYEVTDPAGKIIPVAVKDMWANVQTVYRPRVFPKIWDPEFTLEEDTEAGDEGRRTVKLTITKAGQAAKKLHLYWGEDNSYIEVDALEGTTHSYQYYFDGEYQVLLAYADGSGDRPMHDVTVPFTGK